MTSPITFEEVRRHGWIVVGDDVLDISRFASRHPGGPELGHLRGSDATFPLINAHGIRGEVPALPQKLVIGRVDESTLRPVDRDLRQLWTAFRARGLFDYPLRWLVFDLLRGVALYAAAFCALASYAPLAFITLVVATLNVMWWVHDACHDSIFRSRSTARVTAELVSIVCVGTPVIDYQYLVHRLHHGFTNTIGADQAIDTGPVVWHERMRTRTTNAFVSWQAAFWFGVVLPLTLPYFLFIGVRDALARQRYGSVAGVAVRWAVVGWFLAGHGAIVVGATLLAAYVLGLAASLNHFHRPMAELADGNFARSVTCVTQNLTATGRVSSWLLGGLPLHIEHHLFATMPRRNYHVIAPEIRALCSRHGLPYDEVSCVSAVTALWRKLRAPFANNAPPSRPSMEMHHGRAA